MPGFFRLHGSRTKNRIWFIWKDTVSGGNAVHRYAVHDLAGQGYRVHLQGHPAVNKAASPAAAFFRSQAL